MIPHRTGEYFGEEVPRDIQDEGDPNKYVILVDNDYDKYPQDRLKDCDPSVDHIWTSDGEERYDDDVAKMTLALETPPAAGTVKIELSNSSAVRLFQEDGSLLSDVQVDLASPSGELADLVLEGEIDVWLQGLKKDRDFVFSLILKDEYGQVLDGDSVHLLIAEWTFRGKHDEEIEWAVAVPKPDLIAKGVDNDPDVEIQDEAHFKNHIDGLPTHIVEKLTVQSGEISDDSYEDEVVASSEVTKSRYFGLMYHSEDGELIGPDEKKKIRSNLRTNVVHNQGARTTVQTDHDKQTREVEGSHVELIGVEGDLGKWWVLATFPRKPTSPKGPTQDTVRWKAKLVNGTNDKAKIKFKRGEAEEADVAWDGQPQEIKWTDDGTLEKEIELVDGAGSAPKIKVVDNVFQISGVQQGDKIIIEDEESPRARNEVAVLKNFTWNDMVRWGGRGCLTIHSDSRDLPTWVKRNIIKTIVYCLDQAQNRPQAAHRRKMAQDYAGEGLSTLDIPSARGIGMFPFDLEHGHFETTKWPVPQSVLAAEYNYKKLISQVRAQLKIPLSETKFKTSARRKQFQFRKACLQSDFTYAKEASKLEGASCLYHSYELPDVGDLTAAKYLGGGATKDLHDDDPIRCIRTPLGGEPSLVGPPVFPLTRWGSGFFFFFVDKMGRIHVCFPSLDAVTSAQISDALDDKFDEN